MKEEINKLKGYASSNKLDRDFVLLYRSILREGNSDEVKEVYNLVVALSKSNNHTINRFSYHYLK